MVPDLAAQSSESRKICPDPSFNRSNSEFIESTAGE